MKRLIITMAVATVICTVAFGQDEIVDEKKQKAFSIGGGALFIADFTNWETGSTVNAYGRRQTVENFYNIVRVGGGFNVFFDITYAEINLGFIFGQQNHTNPKITNAEGYKPTDISALRLGVLGKYPIKINDRFTLFPAVALDFELALSAKIDGKDVDYTGMYGSSTTTTSELSALWLKLGIGGDIVLTNKLFLRSEFLYGLRTQNYSEQSLKIEGDSSMIAHGLDVKVAIGYKFFNKN